MMKMCLTLCRNFELPWLDDRSRCRIEVPKKHTPHRTCRKWCKSSGHRRPKTAASLVILYKRQITSKKKTKIKRLVAFPVFVTCIASVPPEGSMQSSVNPSSNTLWVSSRASARLRTAAAFHVSWYPEHDGHVLQHVPNNSSGHSCFTQTCACERRVCLLCNCLGENHWLRNYLEVSVVGSTARAFIHSIVLCSHIYGLLTVASISLWSCEPRQAWYWAKIKNTIDPI